MSWPHKLSYPQRRRRRSCTAPALVVGLTGSVAMGKSTAAALLEHLGITVFKADETVHTLMGAGGEALDAIGTRFPGVVGRGGVDRKALGAQVFADVAALHDLEAILHPLVRAARDRFIRRAARHRRPLVVLDVPLLLEGGYERVCDAVMVMSAPAFLQRQRALARPGMTAERFAGILARQWPDTYKGRLADRVIPSGLGKREALRQLRRFLRQLADKKALHA